MIGATLRALSASARALNEPFELIVVDDASTDGTAAIARAQGASVVSVSLRKISAVRNAGVQVAKGELLVFVDADTLVPEPTLRGMRVALAGGAIAGGARVRFDRHGIGAWARAMGELGCWTLFHLGFAGGCFLFARRTAFDAAGGFDEAVQAVARAGDEIGRNLRRHWSVGGAEANQLCIETFGKFDADPRQRFD